MATIAAIIAAIDAAILSWAGRPVRMRGPDGRETEYRSFNLPPRVRKTRHGRRM